MTTKKTTHVKRLAHAGAPVPLAERVAKSRAALEKRGGVKVPGGWLQPEPARALKYLHSHRYAPTRIGCVAAALVEAAERMQKKTRPARKKP